MTTRETLLVTVDCVGGHAARGPGFHNLRTISRVFQFRATIVDGQLHFPITIIASASHSGPCHRRPVSELKTPGSQFQPILFSHWLAQCSCDLYESVGLGQKPSALGKFVVAKPELTRGRDDLYRRTEVSHQVGTNRRPSIEPGI